MISLLPLIPAPASTVNITSLDQEGRGIARIEGKAVFVEGALPREEVTITMLKRKPTYDVARAETIVKASSARVIPRCPHFGVCGGCTLQHLDAGAQVAAKQRTLEDTLWHLGRVRAAQILPADSRTRLELSTSCAPVGTPRSEKRRRTGRISRTQIELRRRHDVLLRFAAEDLGTPSGTAYVDRHTERSRPVAADRARSG
jgi:tRNA/tmRNA/rRNA uracil-C5-methylase (TrmA/RlmC/RlmD family)